MSAQVKGADGERVDDKALLEGVHGLLVGDIERSHIANGSRPSKLSRKGLRLEAGRGAGRPRRVLCLCSLTASLMRQDTVELAEE
jgi:hypothetical protein